MEQKPITQQEKTAKELRAEERLKRAKADLAKIRRDKKSELRKAQESHKFMMGGCVRKYFPDGYDCYEFSELEINRIIACAFSLDGVKKMIAKVIKERSSDVPENDIAEGQRKDNEIAEEKTGEEASDVRESV